MIFERCEIPITYLISIRGLGIRSTVITDAEPTLSTLTKVFIGFHGLDTNSTSSCTSGSPEIIINQHGQIHNLIENGVDL